MQLSPHTVALCHALAVLSRTRATGVLVLRTELGTMRVAVTEGTPRAATSLPGCDASLGDALLRAGELDPRAHREALRVLGERSLDVPVGVWLQSAGLVAPGAVQLALRAQLRQRIAAALACRSVEHELRAGDASIGVALIEEPPSMADVLVSWLRGQAYDAPHAAPPLVAARQLSAFGRWMLAHASLWPEEAALHVMLRTGASRSEVLALCQAHPRAAALLGALQAVGGVQEAAPRASSYALLARKRTQIRQRQSARVLLDLADGASAADARRALRRFARELHPDALGPDAPDALRQASTEVMGALIDAERELRQDRFTLR